MSSKKRLRNLVPPECLICRDFLFDPYMYPECGHSLCRNCFDNPHSISLKRCPECRTQIKIENALPNHASRRMIMENFIEEYNIAKNAYKPISDDIKLQREIVKLRLALDVEIISNKLKPVHEHYVLNKIKKAYGRIQDIKDYSPENMDGEFILITEWSLDPYSTLNKAFDYFVDVAGSYLLGVSIREKYV